MSKPYTEIRLTFCLLLVLSGCSTQSGINGLAKSPSLFLIGGDPSDIVPFSSAVSGAVEANTEAAAANVGDPKDLIDAAKILLLTPEGTSSSGELDKSPIVEENSGAGKALPAPSSAALASPYYGHTDSDDLTAAGASSEGYFPAGTPPPGEDKRLEDFHTMLREGYIPVGLWSVTEPPVRVRIILSSSPAPATLFVDGTPTAYFTIADLYMIPEQIKSATLQREGFAPCRVADSLIPGLQLFDGGEALKAECKLTALASSPLGTLKRGH